VTACMFGSSESWGPQQHPHPWHFRAGGGAVHSIKSGHWPAASQLKLWRFSSWPYSNGPPWGIVGGLGEICAAMNPALAKTSQVLASTVLAFVLGGYSSVLLGACSEVKGSTATWVVIVCCIVGIAVSVFALMRDAWRSR